MGSAHNIKKTLQQKASFHRVKKQNLHREKPKFKTLIQIDAQDMESLIRKKSLD